MRKISIIGKGNMGTAIGKNFESAGNTVEFIRRDSGISELGDIIVLAVPYSSVKSIIDKYKNALENKIIIDITNPVNFETFDDLVVPSDSSAAALIAKELPNSDVVKAFNTNFASSLVTKKLADTYQTTVLLASDNNIAKQTIVETLDGSNLEILDVGSLKRARELEALGFLQISLAASEKITWSGGFGLFK